MNEYKSETEKAFEKLNNAIDDIKKEINQWFNNHPLIVILLQIIMILLMIYSICMMGES